MHKHGGDIYGNPVMYDFSTNLNFLGMPESVREAAMKGVLLSEHYPDVSCRELKKAISKMEGLPQEMICCGNGAADLIYAAALADRPREAVLVAPTFHEYSQGLKAAGCRVHTVSLREEEGFAYSRRIIEALSDDTDMLVLCNPNNPTAQILSKGLICKILMACRKKHIRLMLDECFVDFLDDPEGATAKEYLADFPELFILRAFTKIYCMPGLRLGYGFSSDALFLKRLAECHQPWNVSVPAQKAGIAACAEGEYVERYRRLLAEEKSWFPQALTEAGARVYGYAANYIFFRWTAGEDLYEQLLARGVLIRDCSNFEGLGKGYYRIVIRNREDNRAFLKILQEIVREEHYG